MKVINILHHPQPPFIFIGRPSKWGNPYIIGRDGNREEVIAKYHAWILTNEDLFKSLPELKGHDLACFCAPLPCHGDVLLMLLKGEEK